MTRRAAWLIALVFVLAGCSGRTTSPTPLATAPPAARNGTAPGNVGCPSAPLDIEPGTVFLGDSIFGLWDLDASFAPGAAVNGGIFGWRSDEILDALPDVLSGARVCHGNPLPGPDPLTCVTLPEPPSRVIIFVGWNNLFQGVRNLSEVDDDIESMIKLCQQAHVPVTIATLYHYDLAHPPGWWNPSVSSEPYIDNLNVINPRLRLLATQYQVPLVDFEAEFAGRSGWTLDGIHPTPEGYELMRQAVVNPASCP